MAGIEWENLDAWLAEAERVGEQLAEELRADFTKMVDQAEVEMRNAAPKPRRGERAATIGQKAIRGRRRLVIDVGPTVPAFSLVFEEFGSRNQTARPWARPALDTAWAGWSPFS